MRSQPHVYIIDDDTELSGFIAEFLNAKGLHTVPFSNPDLLLNQMHLFPADICILDIKMTGISGFEIAKKLRVTYPDMPFLFLSGFSDKANRIQGFKLGADDFLAKPFSMEELCLRVQAILRRTTNLGMQKTIPQSTQYQLHPLFFDPYKQQLTGNETVIKLSFVESKLLEKLCQHMNTETTRVELMQSVWGAVDEHKSNLLNVYISKLRKILKNCPSFEIVNLHGRGYRLINQISNIPNL